MAVMEQREERVESFDDFVKKVGNYSCTYNHVGGCSTLSVLSKKA